MKYKNMKIEINNEQPLDMVVKELERLGYKKAGWVGYRNANFLTANKLGFCTDHAVSFWACFGDSPLTTLIELKAMK